VFTFLYLKEAERLKCAGDHGAAVGTHGPEALQPGRSGKPGGSAARQDKNAQRNNKTRSPGKHVKKAVTDQTAIFWPILKPCKPFIKTIMSIHPSIAALLYMYKKRSG
jgi:hypothetical protein